MLGKGTEGLLLGVRRFRVGEECGLAQHRRVPRAAPSLAPRLRRGLLLPLRAPQPVPTRRRVSTGGRVQGVPGVKMALGGGAGKEEGNKAEQEGEAARGPSRIVRKTVFKEKSGIRRLAAQKSRSGQRCKLRPLRPLLSRARPWPGTAGRCRSAARKRAWGSAPEPPALRRRNYE